ncbi:hypothetical protein [Taibaiella chishuiensis]|uniref:Thioredoxin-like protein n=1 Tax=Taibaiella chishuiensis TaxID=1434707 RepID=A0A2P8D6E3_9BACT|nr:hypothetical protein [Taibaiella chishuiensis]PSK92778.1 hypothetical protein B0I18_103361 [Taibaiella chishuiensis]
MKYLFLCLLLLPAALYAQSSMQVTQNNTVQETEAMEQFKATWSRFADAVLQRDTATIRALSAGCIWCSDCKAQAPPAGDDKFIPVAQFLQHNLPVIFNDASQSRLKDPSKLTFTDDTQNRDLYQAPCMRRTERLSRQKEVQLLVVDPSQETEGLQQAFSFMETPEGYKFCGYSTIP